MLDYIATRARRWLRRLRATRIQSELARVGYTADDLARLAELRTTVAPDVTEAPEAPDAADMAPPTLAEVLDVWATQAPTA